MKGRSNPAWTRNLLRANWAALRALVGPAWMPQTSAPVGARPKYRRRAAPVDSIHEYGSGSYGTVMPTHDPAVVVKITSDPEEARFVAIVLTFNNQAPGIVRYHRIVRLAGAYDNRPVFALWRESADRVGELGYRYHDGVEVLTLAQQAEVREFQLLAEYWVLIALNVRMTLAMVRDTDPVGMAEDAAYASSRVPVTVDYRFVRDVARDYAPPRRLAVCIGALRNLGDAMVAGRFGASIGDALRTYLRRGLLVVDAGDNNMGFVARCGVPTAVITDPGLSVVLTHAYEGVAIPPLG